MEGALSALVLAAAFFVVFVLPDILETRSENVVRVAEDKRKEAEANQKAAVASQKAAEASLKAAEVQLETERLAREPNPMQDRLR